jgi:predicted outer membrane repeat protein
MQDNSSITNNSTNDNGGGIYMNEGTVVIKRNAVISGNKAAKGGGVYFKGITTSSGLPASGEKEASSPKWSQFTMRENAAITNNTAKEGGGVYAEEGTAWETIILETPYTYDRREKIVSYRQMATGFIMEGGTINGNKADFGAGVYALRASLRDEEVLVPNATTRSFPFYSKTGKKIATPAFILSSGSVTGNTAEFVGGGIYIKETGAFSQGKGTVSGNTAGDGEGEDIYQPQ